MLALWAFNYSWSGSSSATATASVSVAPYTYTSGRGKRNNDYQPLDDDYWDVRETSLLRDTSPAKVTTPSEDALSPVKTATLTPRPQNSAPKRAPDERAQTLAAFRNASSIDEMRVLSEKLRKMT